jgi:uncharacterized RDD family membrane protein YckC
MSSETVRLHEVRTPEGISLPFAIAPAGERLSALVIDLSIVFGATLAIWLAGLLLAAGGARGYGLALAVLASFLLRNFYFAFCEVNWGGRTIGKQATRLRVVARDGGPLGAGAVLARNMTREVELFLPLTVLFAGRSLWPDLAGWQLALATLWLFVFAFMPLFNADRLRCGDIVAGTLVVRMPAAVLLSDLAGPPPTARAFRPAGAESLASLAAAAAAAFQPASASGAAYPTAAVSAATFQAAAASATAYPTGAPPPAAVESGIVFTHEQLEIYGIHELQVLEDLLRRDDEGTVDPHIVADVAARIQRKIGWPAERRLVAVRPFLHAFYRAQRGRLEHKLLFGKRQDHKRAT